MSDWFETFNVGTVPSSAQAPGPPTGAVLSQPSQTQLNVAVTAPVSDGGSSIIGYQATLSPGGQTGFSLTPNNIPVTGFTYGTAYQATVRAQNAVSFGPASAPSNSFTPIAVPSAPPGAVTAVAANSRATVTYSQSLNSNGSPITSYLATASTGQSASGSAAGGPITILGLTPGVNVTITVQAVNAAGPSLPSSASNVVTPVVSTTPDAPTIGVLTAVGTTGLSCTFTAPANDGGAAITQYAITYKQNGVTHTGLTTASSPAVLSGLTSGGTIYQVAVQAVNSNGTGPISAYSNSIALGTAGASLTIKVSGKNLVNNLAATIRLKGANFSGMETAPAQGQHPFYGNTINWAYYQTWKPNVVRLPLNAASFLGLSCCTINGAGNGWVSTTAVSADPFGDYISTVDAFIVAAQAAGCNVILDLHWSAPAFTFASVTRNAMPLWQPAFMNSTTDLSFWQAIANRYGTQATPQSGIDNTGILFELFNEPYLDIAAGDNASTWAIMKNGGSVAAFQTNGATTAVAQSWTALGYQQVLSAIRAIGAQNVCIVNGTGYSNASSHFASWMPTDSLSPSQLAVGQHTYPSGTYPYTNGNTYPQTFPDPNAGTITWDTGAKAVLAAGIPLLITEDGGTYGPAATSGEPHITTMTNWVDANGASYVGWAWINGNPGPANPATNGSNMLYTTGNVPTVGQGQTTFNWMSGANQVPTQVQLLLQGQTSQNKATDSGGPITRFQPQNANYSMIGWLSVPGATSYNIYRATIPIGSQATGLSYSLYATVTAAAASSAYSGYVSGSGSAPIQTGVDSAYGDSAATGCVATVRGGGTATTPTAGDLWAGVGYSYKVSAVVGGVESAQSAAHFGVYIGNGLRILHQNSFNNEPNTAANNGGTTPNGSTLVTDWSETVQGYMNPYAGNGATTWALNMRQWNYMEVWAKCSAGTPNINISGENETDLTLSGAQSTAAFANYATWVVGQYVHFKIPLADFWTDATRGRQNSWYKVIVSKNGGTMEIWLDNWIFTT